jgi:hypothetical protein
MVGEDGDLSGLRYKARLRYAAAWSSWIGVWGKSIAWFPDTIDVADGDAAWDRILRMDGVRGPAYPQNHCTRLW